MTPRQGTLVGVLAGSLAIASTACLIVALEAQAAPAATPMRSGVMSWYGDAPGEAGGPIACGTGRLNVRAVFVAMRRDSGTRCGQRVVLCADATARCAWVRVLDRGPFVAGRVVDASPPVLVLLGLDPAAGVYRVTWRPVPTTATRGCSFPRWVGRPYYPGCER